MLISNMKIGLSTQALEPDSLDPDPQFGFIAVTRELHMTRRLRSLDCWTGSLPTAQEHCHGVQHAALIRIKAVWMQSGLWIKIPDPHRIRIQGGRVESPNKNLN